MTSYDPCSERLAAARRPRATPGHNRNQRWYYGPNPQASGGRRTTTFIGRFPRRLNDWKGAGSGVPELKVQSIPRHTAGTREVKEPAWGADTGTR